MTLQQPAQPDGTSDERQHDGAPEESAERTPGKRSRLAFPVVGIGASAGGLEAFSGLLRALPKDPGVALVFVQHLAPRHDSRLPEILARETSLAVVPVTDGMAVERDHVYVIPPAETLEIAGGVLQFTARGETKAHVHYPIDTFFRSLAADQGHQAIGVVLSGTATDGTLGLEEIKAEGGITFAQDDSAAHVGMPHSAVASGCVDFVLPPDGIAREIVRIARHPFLATGDRSAGPAVGERDLAQVLGLLRKSADVDFSNYKRNTLQRRIRRRVVLHKLDNVTEYLRLLRENPVEVEALVQDILIRVTSFFRDPTAYEALRMQVFPKLVQDRPRGDPVRVWVQGCSTGEEAYSIAILFAEFCDSASLRLPLQMFATDLNARSVERARVGLYPRSIASDVSAERLRRFFVEVDGSYRVSNALRDSCIFAHHDVLTAPPFSRIDLVSCRNVLIYLEPVLQQKLMVVLHYALRPHGFLLLGSSETIGGFQDLFELVDPRAKIYSRKSGPPRNTAISPLVARPGQSVGAPARPGATRETAFLGAETHKEADRLLLARYGPPSVLVTHDFEVVQFRGDTGPYLSPPAGRASFNLLKMLREGLLMQVRGALERARANGRPARAEGLRVRSNGGFRDVNVEVVPLGTEPREGGALLVIFEDPSEPGVARARAALAAAAVAPMPLEEGSAAAEVVRINQELGVTREYLQSVIEQQEAANEELQSANEEVQSANEELQSINEELETSKEEIESSNEELSSVNDELQNRNLELAQANNDLQNLLTSVQLPIVMLGSDLRIRRFTPAAAKLLDLAPTDIGRPIGDIRMNLSVDEVQPLVEEVIDTVAGREVEVQDRHGRWHLMRLRPYRTADSRIEGAVIVFVDIDTLKRSQDAQRRLNELLDSAYEPILMWDFDTGAITYWNHGAEETYGWSRTEAIGAVQHVLLGLQPGQLAFREELSARGKWTGELVHRSNAGGMLEVESRMVLVQADGQPVVIECNRPIEERKQMERALRLRADELLDMDKKRNEFLAMLAHELRNPLAPIMNGLHVLRSEQARPEMIERSKDLMERQVRHLSRMVDDLLDVARIMQGRVNLQREVLDATDLLRRVVESLRGECERRPLDLQLELPSKSVWVDADALRLEQVFLNLLHNACKFTPAQGHVRVSAEIETVADGSRPEGTRDDLVVLVRDDGIGMAPEMLSSVFDLFTQADTSLNRAYGGLGIGLTIVQRIVTLHGGTVEARSEGLGRGSDFVVRLPATRTGRNPRPADEPAKPLQAGPPRRVLVVDDNVDSAESLAMLLRMDGHVVHVAHEGNSALDEAQSLRPEVIVLDIGLPGRDGYALAAELRSRPGFENTRLVAFSGYGRSGDRRRATEAGFDHHLLKPCDPDEIRRLVARGGVQRSFPRTSPGEG